MHGLPQPAPQDTISQLFPDSQLGLRLWTTYVKNVDPVLKVLHIPTVQSVVINTIVSPQTVEPSNLALVFAIFFAAVTSLSRTDLATITSSSYQTLLSRYATGLNLALLKGDCLNNPKVSELQALATYAVRFFFFFFFFFVFFFFFFFFFPFFPTPNNCSLTLICPFLRIK